MQSSRRFKYSLFVFTLFVLMCPNRYAQPFTVQASAGFVYLPLHDWSRFFGGTTNSFYYKNNPNLYYELSFQYSINSKSAINIGTELINSSAYLSSSYDRIDWKFQGLPISIGYGYKVLSINKYSALIIGAGISYFLSKVSAHDSYFNTTGYWHGNGYGVNASVELNTMLTKKLGLISRIRYRYSNGTAFTEKKGDIKVEFTGFDFGTGLSWSF